MRIPSLAPAGAPATLTMARAEAREHHLRREDSRPGARPGRMARKGATETIARMRARSTNVTVAQRASRSTASATTAKWQAAAAMVSRWKISWNPKVRGKGSGRRRP